jgi:hypothetical protein
MEPLFVAAHAHDRGRITPLLEKISQVQRLSALCWPLLPLQPKRSAYGFAFFRFRSGQRDLKSTLMVSSSPREPSRRRLTTWQVKADSIRKLNRTGKNQVMVTAPFGAQPEKVDQYEGASGFSAGPFFVWKIGLRSKCWELTTNNHMVMISRCEP